MRRKILTTLACRLIGLLLVFSSILPFWMHESSHFNNDDHRHNQQSRIQHQLLRRDTHGEAKSDKVRPALVNTNAIATGQVSSSRTSGKLRSTSFHFLVSSDCSPYQRWQVLTQIHSALSVGQEGRYTWILSGCPPEGGDGDNEGASNVNARHNNEGKKKKSKPHGQDGTVMARSAVRADIEKNFAHLCGDRSTSAAHDVHEGLGCPSVHFSPDFADMTVYGGEYADGKKKREYTNKDGKVTRSTYGNTYRFNNKPNGLRHWAEAGQGQAGSGSSSFDPDEDEAIVLIDPDFLFLRKFDLPANVTVSSGRPAAASYGLGDQWLDFDRAKICGAESRCVNVSRREVYQHYSAGPPYILHASDVPQFAKRWCELVPPTYDEYPLLYAEMFAYSMAAAHLDLKHALLKDLFTGCMVKWKGEIGSLSKAAMRFISAFDSSSIDVLEPKGQSGAASCFGSDVTPPPLLHYCQRYPFRLQSGEWRVLAKRRVSHDVLECNHNDTLLPWKEDNKEASSAGFVRNKEEYWHALSVCSVIRGVAYARRAQCSSKVP